MAIELSLLDKLKYRVQLARKIETSRHKVKKTNHERNWMRETAEAMEIELDSDFVRSAPSPVLILDYLTYFQRRRGQTSGSNTQVKRRQNGFTQVRAETSLVSAFNCPGNLGEIYHLRE